MNRRQSLFILVKVIAIIVVAFLLFMTKPEKEPTPPAPERTMVIPPVVSEAIDWESQSEQSLQTWETELTELVEPGSSAVEFSAIVADGESVISKVIERSPGVFHLTTLTPTLSFEGETGEETITIKSERLAMTLGGDLDRMSAPSIVITPESIGSVSVFSDHSLYRMSVSARPVDGGIKISGVVIEEDR